MMSVQNWNSSGFIFECVRMGTDGDLDRVWNEPGIAFVTKPESSDHWPSDHLYESDSRRSKTSIAPLPDHYFLKWKENKRRKGDFVVISTYAVRNITSKIGAIKSKWNTVIQVLKVLWTWQTLWQKLCLAITITNFGRTICWNLCRKKGSISICLIPGICFVCRKPPKVNVGKVFLGFLCTCTLPNGFSFTHG